MSSKIVVGLDGHGPDNRAVAFARRQADLIGSCEIVLVYVIEWSPFSFQTPEENAERHKRREEEIALAQERVIKPAVDALSASGASVRGIVRHGDVAERLEAIAIEEGADQIVVARTSDKSLSARLFGSSTANLVMHSKLPVTVVG